MASHSDDYSLSDLRLNAAGEDVDLSTSDLRLSAAGEDVDLSTSDLRLNVADGGYELGMADPTPGSERESTRLNFKIFAPDDLISQAGIASSSLAGLTVDQIAKNGCVMGGRFFQSIFYPHSVQDRAQKKLVCDSPFVRSPHFGPDTDWINQMAEEALKNVQAGVSVRGTKAERDMLRQHVGLFAVGICCAYDGEVRDAAAASEPAQRRTYVVLRFFAGCDDAEYSKIMSSGHRFPCKRLPGLKPHIHMLVELDGYTVLRSKYIVENSMIDGPMFIVNSGELLYRPFRTLGLTRSVGEILRRDPAEHNLLIKRAKSESIAAITQLVRLSAENMPPIHKILQCPEHCHRVKSPDPDQTLSLEFTTGSRTLRKVNAAGETLYFADLDLLNSSKFEIIRDVIVHLRDGGVCHIGELVTLYGPDLRLLEVADPKEALRKIVGGDATIKFTAHSRPWVLSPNTYALLLWVGSAPYAAVFTVESANTVVTV